MGQERVLTAVVKRRAEHEDRRCPGGRTAKGFSFMGKAKKTSEVWGRRGKGYRRPGGTAGQRTFYMRLAPENRPFGRYGG